MMKILHFSRNAKTLWFGLMSGLISTGSLAQESLLEPIIFPSPCSTIACGPEKVVNGDFENGNNSFGSDYDSTSTGCATYAVVSNANTYNGNWQTTDDHTNPSNPDGLFYVGDAPCGALNIPLETAWRQNVTVRAGEEYIFSAWVSNLSNHPFNLPIVQLNIQTSLMTVPITIASKTLPFTANTWEQICGSYTAATSETITISISVVPSLSLNSTVINVSGIGADFGLDDISFKGVNPINASFSYYRTSSCTDQLITFAAHSPEGTHYWDFGSSFATPSTANGPSVQVTYSKPGTYTVKHTVSSGLRLACTRTYEMQITVDCVSSTCVPGLKLCGNNLAVNGDFEQGNTGFQSQYDSVTAPTRCGTYAIVSDAYAFHPGHWFTRDDHTYPNDPKGLFFVGDAQCTGVLQKAWYQRVYVQGGSQYLFSAWVSNLDDAIYTNDAAFVLTVDGTPITSLPPIAVPSIGKINSGDRWSEICGSYLARLSGWVTIAVEVVPSKGLDADGELTLQNVGGLGADFGLDDISFMAYCNDVLPTQNRYGTEGNSNDLEEAQSSLSINTFPNPLSDNVNIQLEHISSGNLVLEVYDLNGKLVHQITNTRIDNQPTANYSWAPAPTIQSGVYLLKIQNGSTVLNHKLLISK